jgi:transcriptional regulator GlxA family with amidase domain
VVVVAETTKNRRFTPGRRLPRRVVFLVIEPVQPLDLFGPLEVFSSANRSDPRTPAYDIEVLSWGAPLIRGESSVSIEAPGRAPADPPPMDTLVVVGGYESRGVQDPRLNRWLTEAHTRARRVASICVAAFFLARAGLLDGRVATTHWMCAAELADGFPAVRVEAERIWTRDGKVYTSAGVTSGIDLALALVGSDLGHAAALEVARALVVFLQRPGNQSQFSVVLEAQGAEKGALRDLQAWIAERPRERHSVASMAARVHMSPRNFTRVFTREAGCPPAHFVLRVRVEAGQRLLEHTSDGVEAVAAECGFESAEVMTRAFQRLLSTTPAQYRRRFRASPDQT